MLHPPRGRTGLRLSFAGRDPPSGFFHRICLLQSRCRLLLSRRSPFRAENTAGVTQFDPKLSTQSQGQPSHQILSISTPVHHVETTGIDKNPTEKVQRLLPLTLSDLGTYSQVEDEEAYGGITQY